MWKRIGCALWLAAGTLGCGQGAETEEWVEALDPAVSERLESQAPPTTEDGEATPAGSELGTTSEALTRPTVCFASSQCPRGTHCSVEDGVCDSACPPGRICPAVCAGTCVRDAAIPLPPGPNCGTATCGKGTFCCNASCNTCAPRGGACTQQICPSPI